MIRPARVVPVTAVLAMLAALLLALPTPAKADVRSGTQHEVVRIWHAAVVPTSVEGTGLGTVRTWFTPTLVNGVSAPDQYMTGTLTTVAIDASAGVEWRTSNLVFVVGGLRNQLVVGGASTYPAGGATIAPGTKAIRPVIGATGAYKGMTGYVVTTNLGERGWDHVFHLTD